MLKIKPFMLCNVLDSSFKMASKYILTNTRKTGRKIQQLFMPGVTSESACDETCLGTYSLKGNRASTAF